jgi:CubicO group peptidase (beta-lactamase class C family)
MAAAFVEKRRQSCYNRDLSDDSLIPAYDDQQARFTAAFSAIRQAIGDRVFPGASLAVTHNGKLIALKSFGSFACEADLDPNPPVEPDTIFDLASLTKPVATTTMAEILYERGLLELDAAVAGVVPEILVSKVPETAASDPRRSQITFRMLLAHSSGLPAYEKLFARTNTGDNLLRAAFAVPLTADPGTHEEYSDIGFIILGVALERIAGETIDRFCQREIFGPLSMARTTFNPSMELRSQIPPTADERPFPDPSGTSIRSTFRKRIIQGEVQDENASILGGVAGHAGLFSNAHDIARFAHCMLRGGAPVLRSETVSVFTRRESSPAGTSRTLGWDTPSVPSQSGRYFGPNSYGHLGYTGTSLWIDPDRDLSITFLTNRTWPGCSNWAIKQVRPRIQDAIVEALP